MCLEFSNYEGTRGVWGSVQGLRFGGIGDVGIVVERFGVYGLRFRQSSGLKV